MRLAPEGRPFVGAALGVLAVGVALAVWRGGWWVLPAAVWTPLALWVPWFFRDPERGGPRGDRLVLAPADGKIVSIEEVDEPTVLGARAVRVSVFMNVFSVHVNRYPVSGTLSHRVYRPGAFVNATLDKASELNEQMTIGMTSPHGPLVVRQIAGLVARRIVTDGHPGDVVHQGDRLGLIRFGSRVDTFLPIGTRVLVSVGDRATAGRTVLAEWSS